MGSGRGVKLVVAKTKSVLRFVRVGELEGVTWRSVKSLTDAPLPATRYYRVQATARPLQLVPTRAHLPLVYSPEHTPSSPISVPGTSTIGGTPPKVGILGRVLGLCSDE